MLFRNCPANGNWPNNDIGNNMHNGWDGIPRRPTRMVRNLCAKDVFTGELFSLAPSSLEVHTIEWHDDWTVFRFIDRSGNYANDSWPVHSFNGHDEDWNSCPRNDTITLNSLHLILGFARRLSRNMLKQNRCDGRPESKGTGYKWSVCASRDSRSCFLFRKHLHWIISKRKFKLHFLNL